MWRSPVSNLSLNWARVDMHKTVRAIKIIKREHRNAVVEKSGMAEASLKTEKEIRREILNTITSWVEHQREAKKGLLPAKQLFQRETFASTLLAGLKKQESEPELL